MLIVGETDTPILTLRLHLQGVVIFALIVCKRSVLKSLRRRLGVNSSKGQTKLLESDKKEGGF